MNCNFADFEVGVDAVAVSRFEKLKPRDAFIQKVFTKSEIEYCFHKAKPAEGLAARFAAKEAIIKTLKDKPHFNQIEIQNTDNGKPTIEILDPKINCNYTFKVSLTHTADLAIAMCLTINH